MHGVDDGAAQAGDHDAVVVIALSAADWCQYSGGLVVGAEMTYMLECRGPTGQNHMLYGQWLMNLTVLAAWAVSTKIASTKMMKIAPSIVQEVLIKLRALGGTA